MAGWREALSEMTDAAIDRARTGWDRPYPPDPGAFKCAGEWQDVAEQFAAASQAAGRRPATWHQVAARTYHAAMGMAVDGISLAGASWGGGEGAAARAWKRRYSMACRLEDLGLLPPPPPPPAAVLEHRRDQAAADRGCARARAVLAGRIPPPPEPPHSAQYLEKVNELGIAPRKW